MPAERFTKKANVTHAKRQWDHVYESAKKHGASPGSAIRQANACREETRQVIGTIWLHDLPTRSIISATSPCSRGGRPAARSQRWLHHVDGHRRSSHGELDIDRQRLQLHVELTHRTKPVGAIYLARDGEIVIGAAGATNCAGKGGPYTTCKGTIPLDSGNSNTITIEAGNAGTGEPWPTAQQDAYVALVAALCSYYDFDPWRDVMAHFEWAPTEDRPSRSVAVRRGGNKWNMDLFRNDVTELVGGGQLPIPPTA